jgi:hypothetical protein
MTPLIVWGLMAVGLLGALTLPAIGLLALDAWRTRQLPPHLRALARHADGDCLASACPYRHDFHGGQQ